MSKFNQTKTNEITNLAGGVAYVQNQKLQLVSILLTSFGDDKYYRSAKAEIDILKSLIRDCDKEFVAKAIVYARTQFGMRTITHIASSILAKHIGKEKYARNFFNKVVYRPDDMLEIVAYHKLNKEKLSNAMKRGFADAVGRFDEYQLAKYRGDKKGVKMVDIVNITHPKPTKKNGVALNKLVNGELVSFDTWEVELSAAGSDINAKKKVWHKLISEKKLGYFALLRNIRNIVQLNDSELSQTAFDALQNEVAIKKSLVLPFRFSTAYDELGKVDGNAMRAISRACNIACNNVPKLSGKTLIALDVSGSMDGKPAQIASLFAAVLLRSNDCDLVEFANDAKYKNVNADDSVLSIAGSLRFVGGGTNFPSVFSVANKKYDRVILLSDMQSWMRGYDSPKAAYNNYRKQYNPECKFYSFDLNGYGTMQIPERNVFCLAGFSDKVFDIMKFYETDSNALISEINKISLTDK